MMKGKCNNCGAYWVNICPDTGWCLKCQEEYVREQELYEEEGIGLAELERERIKQCILIKCPDCDFTCQILSPKYDWHRLLRHFKLW
jgi:hypothetical protein